MKVLGTLPEHLVPIVEAIVKDEEPDAVLFSEEFSNLQPVNGLGNMVLAAAAQHIEVVIASRALDIKIYVCAVVSAEAQAFAVQLSPDEYCIAIWIGVVGQINNALAHLLKTTAMSEFFGLPTVLPANAPLAPLGDNVFAAFQALVRTPTSEPPLDRQDIGDVLIVSAFQWLVLHEVGHILNGHLGLLGEEQFGSRRLIVEVQSDPLTEDQALTFHTLEMDADAFATSQSLRLFLTNRLIPVPEGAEPTKYAVGIAAAGVYLMLRTFDSAELQTQQLIQGDHPEPAVRASMTFSLIATIFLDGQPTMTPERTEIVNSALSTSFVIEEAISEATGLESRAGNIRATLDPAVMAYTEKLLARWARLRPTLMLHKRGVHNLAPAQRDPA